jgi:hypothetical protein
MFHEEQILVTSNQENKHIRYKDTVSVQNTPQYVLDTTMHKAKTKQTTICVGHHHTQGEDKTNHNT